MSKGFDLMSEERMRQVREEGWTSAHDDSHDYGQMEYAAECYWECAVNPGFVIRVLEGTATPRWPWDWTWFRPFDKEHRGYFPRVDTLRCLVKAGALLMAESDRMLRRGDTANRLRLDQRIQHCAAAIDNYLAKEGS